MFEESGVATDQGHLERARLLDYHDYEERSYTVSSYGCDKWVCFSWS